MATSAERLRDLVVRRPREQIMGRYGDVLGTSVVHVL